MDLKHIISQQKRRTLGPLFDIDYVNYSEGFTQVGIQPVFSRASSGTFVNERGLIVGKTKSTTTIDLRRLVKTKSIITLNVPNGSTIGWLNGYSVYIMQDSTGNDVHNDGGDGLWVEATILHVSDTKLTVRVINTSWFNQDTLPISNWWVSYRGPRRSYDPITLRPIGFLMENSRRNLLLHSENFGANNWSKVNSSCPISSVISPDGSTVAYVLKENTATTDSPRVQQQVTNSLTASKPYTMSVFAKAASHTTFQIVPSVTTFGGSKFANFILSGSGSVGNVSSGVVASIQPYPNGWYRCIVTVSSVSGESGGYVVFSANNNDSSANRLPIYQSTGAEVVYLWGAQLEEHISGTLNGSPNATSYIPTTISQAIRSPDASTTTGISVTPSFTIDAEVKILSGEGASTSGMFQCEKYQDYGFRAGFNPSRNNFAFWSSESLPPTETDSFNVVSANNTFLPGESIRLTLTYDASTGNARIWKNGVNIVSSQPNKKFIVPPSTLGIGINRVLNSTTQNILYRKISFYNRVSRPSPATLHDLTLGAENITLGEDQITITI